MQLFRICNFYAILLCLVHFKKERQYIFVEKNFIIINILAVNVAATDVINLSHF